MVNTEHIVFGALLPCFCFMLTKTQKVKIVEDLADRFQRQKIAVFSDFHGVPVMEISGLRRLLKQQGSEYKVAKKTLLDRALEAVGSAARTKGLQGEIGVAFGYSDGVGLTKVLSKFSKDNQTFKILGGILAGKILSAAEILVLSRLPSREALLGQLLGALQSPIHAFAAVLQANTRNLAIVLNKIRSNK